MQRKNSFDSFPIRNPANGESLIESYPSTTNDDAGENLDPFLIALYHARMNPDGVANVERRDARLQLLLFDLLNCVHKMNPARLKDRTGTAVRRNCKQKAWKSEIFKFGQDGWGSHLRRRPYLTSS